MYRNTPFCSEDDPERFFIWYGISLFKIRFLEFYNGRSRFSGKLCAGLWNSWICQMEPPICIEVIFRWRCWKSGSLKDSFYWGSWNIKNWIKAKRQYGQEKAYLSIWISGNIGCWRKDGKETGDVWGVRRSHCGSNLCKGLWTGHWPVRTDGRDFGRRKAFLWWLFKCFGKWTGRDADWCDPAKSWSGHDRWYETNENRRSKNLIFPRYQWRCDSCSQWRWRGCQWPSKRSAWNLWNKSGAWH